MEKGPVTKASPSVGVCMTMYGKVPVVAMLIDCYFAAADEMVTRAGRISRQELYLKCGE